MLLKRLYDEKQNVRAVKILRLGQKQNLSPRLVEAAVAQGWMKLEQGRITLKAEPQDVTLRIVSAPGYYCCHCDAAWDNGASGRTHIAQAHKGELSPDPNNPAGYRRDNFFACERE